MVVWLLASACLMVLMAMATEVDWLVSASVLPFGWGLLLARRLW